MKVGRDKDGGWQIAITRDELNRIKQIVDDGMVQELKNLPVPGLDRLFIRGVLGRYENLSDRDIEDALRGRGEFLWRSGGEQK